MTKRWLQIPVAGGVLERHSPPTSGCRKVTKSTTPSSSPLLGKPSGPSLSKGDQASSWPGRLEIESSAETSIAPIRFTGRAEIGRAPSELQSLAYLVCRL